MSYKKFTKDISFGVLGQIITALAGIFVMPLITKNLGVQSYGVWTQLLITMVFISTFATLNLPYCLVRFLPGEKDKREIRDGIWSVFFIVLSISLMVALLLIAFAKPLSKFLDSPEIFIQILAFIIIFEYLNQIFFNALRAFQQNIASGLFSISQKIGEVLLIILAIYLGYGLLGAVISFLIIRIIIFGAIGINIIGQVGFAPPKFSKTKEYLKFGVPAIPDTVSNWAINSSDRYLIGYFMGTLSVGYYASAYNIGLFVIYFLVAPFSFLLPAILSKFYDENKHNEVNTYLKYSLKYFLLLAIPAAFGLSILSKQVLTILTTPESAEAGYLIMPIIAFSMILMGINAIIGQIIGIVKKTMAGGVIVTISAALNIGLNFIFIPLFGIMGAAVTTLIAFVFLCALTWIYSFRKFSFEVDWKFILKSISASLIMALAVFLINPIGLYRVMSTIAIGILIYFALITLLKGFSKKEFQLLKQFIKRI